MFYDFEFVSDYDKSNVSYKQQKGYITVFWNGDSYYPAGILPVQSQKQTLKTLKQDVKCI